MRPTKKVIRATAVFLVLAGAILWIPVVGALLGHGPGFLRNLGFVSGPRGTLPAWILAMLVAVFYSGFAVRNIGLVAEHWRRWSSLKAVSLAVAVAAAIVEEAFFRRLIMDAMMNTGASVLLQILGSAVVFGLAHGVWGIATKRFRVAIKTTIATGAVGAALAVVYLIGGRSLAPPIVSHFIIDAVIQPGILLAAFSGDL